MHPLFSFALPVVLSVLQKRFMCQTPQEHHDAAQPRSQNAQKQRRRRPKQREHGRSPTWTAHHSHNPHHFARDFAAYAIPLAFESLAKMQPLKRPRKRGIWLFGYKDFIIDFTEYEVDRQLRKGLPDLGGPHQHGRASQRLDGSFLKTDKFFKHGAEMVAYEVEREVRRWVRKYTRQHGHPPDYPEGVQPSPKEEHMASGALRLGRFGPARLALKFADLDPEQRKFIVAALVKRLGHMINVHAGEILDRVDRGNGTLWGIGHDDLVEMTVARNFDLDSVRQETGPRFFTNGPTLDRNSDTNTTEREPSGPAAGPETPTSAATAQTEWPSLDFLRTQGWLSTPKAAAKPKDTKGSTKKPGLGPAEPSVSRVLGLFSSRPRTKDKINVMDKGKCKNIANKYEFESPSSMGESSFRSQPNGVISQLQAPASPRRPAPSAINDQGPIGLGISRIPKSRDDPSGAANSIVPKSSSTIAISGQPKRAENPAITSAEPIAAEVLQRESVKEAWRRRDETQKAMAASATAAQPSEIAVSVQEKKDLNPKPGGSAAATTGRPSNVAMARSSIAPPPISVDAATVPPIAAASKEHTETLDTQSDQAPTEPGTKKHGRLNSPSVKKPISNLVAEFQSNGQQRKARPGEDKKAAASNTGGQSPQTKSGPPYAFGSSSKPVVASNAIILRPPSFAGA